MKLSSWPVNNKEEKISSKEHLGEIYVLVEKLLNDNNEKILNNIKNEINEIKKQNENFKKELLDFKHLLKKKIIENFILNIILKYNIKLNYDKNILKFVLNNIKFKEDIDNMNINIYEEEIKNLLLSRLFKEPGIKENIINNTVDIKTIEKQKIKNENITISNQEIDNKQSLYLPKELNNNFIIKNPVFYLSKSGNGDRIMKRLYENLKVGIITSAEKEYISNSTSIVWGILRGSEYILKQCMLNDEDFYYIDHAYFNSGHNKLDPCYRITKNAFQARNIIKRDDKRLNLFNIKMNDWKKDGEHILVCPPTEASMDFFNVKNWLYDTINNIKKYTNRPIIIRKKPTEIQIQKINGFNYPLKNENKQHIAMPTLDEHLNNCHALVTYNSNVAVEAIMKGIPAFVDNVSCAYTLGNVDLQNINKPIYAEREEWIKHLSYSQFYLSELCNPEIWKIIVNSY